MTKPMNKIEKLTPLDKKNKNYLTGLIEALCPQGVKFQALGEVGDIYDGTHQTPKYTDEGVKFVSVENIKSLYTPDGNPAALHCRR